MQLGKCTCHQTGRGCLPFRIIYLLQELDPTGLGCQTRHVLVSEGAAVVLDVCDAIGTLLRKGRKDHTMTSNLMSDCDAKHMVTRSEIH
jgi:hypothetical protein